MLRNKRLPFILLLIYSTTSLESDIEGSKNISAFRARRQVNSLPLVFPYGASNKFIIGFGFPVPMRDKYIEMAFGFNFQYQYVQFDNASALSKYYFIKTVSREQRDADLALRKNERLAFYKSTADMLTAKGLNGPECVLRAICEAAQYPVHEEALIGELIHILLTPDYGHSLDEEDTEWLEASAVYRDAANAGRQMFDCAYIYSGCPEGRALELISELRDE